MIPIICALFRESLPFILSDFAFFLAIIFAILYLNAFLILEEIKNDRQFLKCLLIKNFFPPLLSIQIQEKIKMQIKKQASRQTVLEKKSEIKKTVILTLQKSMPILWNPQRHTCKTLKKYEEKKKRHYQTVSKEMIRWQMGLACV